MPWTRTSEVANASDREWLVPSARRKRVKALCRSRTARAARASPSGRRPCSSHVSGTRAAVLTTASGTATVMAAGLDLRLQLLDLLAVAAVELVRHLAVELDAVIFFAFVTWTNGDFAVEPTAVRATVRAHWPSPSAFVTPTSSRPSSGLRVVEGLDAAEERADVPEQDAARLALVPELVVDLDASP